MWKEANINIVVAGAGASCGAILETLNHLGGVHVTGVVDYTSSPATMDVAKDLGIPMANRIDDLPGLARVNVLLNATSNPEIGDHLRRHKPEHALVLNDCGARLVRLLVMSLRKTGRDRDRLETATRVATRAQGGEARIVGQSQAVYDLQDLIERVAPTPATVLLLGETGTGKDLAARVIHQASHLKDKPFVSINCTALTASLMESELFGYKKGAFTGAEEDRPGLIEEAHGGTLFLDEVGDMQLELQAKLLRFLQTGELRRVGSTRTRHVQVRVIAATNRDLDAAVAAETFRRDLYYRFNAFTLRLPPLRERREDIPYLTQHFIAKAEARLNMHIAGIDAEALTRMQAYHWPGNIRELENVVERAAILMRGEQIMVHDLAITSNGGHHGLAPSPSAPAPQGQGDPKHLGPGAPATVVASPAPPEDRAFTARKEAIMDNFEKKEMLRYLMMAEGNITEACRLSGIPRRTFYRKMKKHGI